MFLFTTERQRLSPLANGERSGQIAIEAIDVSTSRSAPFNGGMQATRLSDKRTTSLIHWWSWLGCNLLLMGLFVEWLLPFYQSTYLSMSIHLSTWLIPMGAALMIGLCCSSKWLRGGLVCLTVLFVSAWASLGEETWLTNVLSMPRQLVVTIHSWAIDVEGMAMYFITGEHFRYSDAGEMAVILVFIMLLSLLVQSLMTSSYSVSLFSTATIVYLLLMEKIMGLDTGDGLVRAFIWTMIAISWLQLQRQREGSDQSTASWPARWWLATISLAVVLVVAYTLWAMTFTSRSPVVWPALEAWVQEKFEKLIDNDDRMQAQANKDGRPIASVGMTGYGQDDRQLGMPIRLNKAVLFRATTPYPTYWRAESKRIYTGQGWDALDDREQEEMIQLVSSNNSSSSNFMADAWTEPFEQHVRFEQIPAGMPVLHGGRLIQVNREPVNISDTKVMDYTVKVSHFIGTPALFAGLIDADDPEQLQRKYTELPAHLPSRIEELTAKLMVGASNRYERVQRVQRYLLENYVYTTEATSVPEEEADFVDHFLFEQRQGYCVHFSTAMAVMLRTQGIPTRWVKGFAPGEQEADGTYTVRHSDAHAWVEVFIPEVGWVPFDPTPARGIVQDVEQAVAVPARADVIQGENASYELNAQLYNRALGGTAMTVDSILTHIQKWLNPIWESTFSAMKAGGEKLLMNTTALWQQLLAELEAWQHQAFWTDWLATIITFLQGNSWGRLWGAYPISVSIAAVVLLIAIGGLARWLTVSISRKSPLWTLRFLLRKQQRNYSRSRALRIGELAWSIMQSRLGERAPSMTLECYVQAGCEKLGNKLTHSERDALKRFISCSNEMLYAAVDKRLNHHDELGRICSELFPTKKRRVADF
ncbi:transglutaminase-like domain-containing protein [Paenibacillus arenosi]|uniref:Transglutaminase domain-containing protein n=1 Tax=Paenibacillus arenosi TaxID=2774142 RepID=A0ABR9B395_9BACL|nr:transglutaminase-like domain-containing protein [Paenibacillus arenosi]MBD8500838.1 transglutaminase domain-containing protein [Paenibacillus arenosi]